MLAHSNTYERELHTITKLKANDVTGLFYFDNCSASDGRFGQLDLMSDSRT